MEPELASVEPFNFGNGRFWILLLSPCMSCPFKLWLTEYYETVNRSPPSIRMLSHRCRFVYRNAFLLGVGYTWDIFHFILGHLKKNIPFDLSQHKMTTFSVTGPRKKCAAPSSVTPYPVDRVLRSTKYFKLFFFWHFAMPFGV